MESILRGERGYHECAIQGRYMEKLGKTIIDNNLDEIGEDIPFMRNDLSKVTERKKEYGTFTGKDM